MRKSEKRIIGTLVALLFMVGILGAASVQAADYPKRKIEWKLWYGPGGGTDIFSRTIGIPARRYLKPAPLIIINIPGAAGANGMIYTMEQPADGYTITSIGNDIPINDVLKRAKFKGEAINH